MKMAGYIFLALLLAILMYLSVERFTVTITGVDSATPPVVTQMASPIPTSAMSTTAGSAAPVGISNSAVSLAPPLSAALQPPIPPTPPTPPAQSRLAELEQEEIAAVAAYRAAASAEVSGRIDGVGSAADGIRLTAATENLLRIQNELGNLRR